MAIKSLDIEQQISIQALIRTWEGKLTWDLLVIKIEANLAISTTRQTLDKYLNIKNEYKQKKRSFKGRYVANSNKELISYLEKDIDMAEKIIQLEAQLKIAKEEIGYLQAFIQNLSSIAQHNPIVMNIFQKTLNDIQANSKIKHTSHERS
ncbi:hypothetical protein L2735_18150 [Shewanella olleyana]|uniref:hypothetical protein n=1 Tax=Shewanella olleyana TaxID=135626 RepID=UPI00200D7ED7|nr:hypothetical protein [Shewanella olleyana]MCL1068695.1 hypothetical protein [Shewanella olleyana]